MSSYFITAECHMMLCLAGVVIETYGMHNILASFPGSSLLPRNNFSRMTFDPHDKLSGGRAWEILSDDQRHATSPIH